MECKLRPTEDRVVILQNKKESMTKGGIVLPDNASAEKISKRGKILAVGPGKFSETTEQRIPMTLKVGDEVIFPQYGGHIIDLPGDDREGNRDDVRVMRESEVLAVIVEEAEE